MPKSCSVEGCDRPRYGHGWCHLHYQRQKKHGSPHVVLTGGRRRSGLAETFWQRVPVVAPVMRLEPDAFGHWLAGFIDGEGSFQIAKAAPRTAHNVRAYSPRFMLTLREDDAPVVRSVYVRTGLGSVAYCAGRPPTRPAVTWCVNAKADCEALAALLVRYPLLTKKARDFAVWNRAVAAWQQTGRGLRDNEWSELAGLRSELQAARRYLG